jgi:hypothetical protein
MPIDLYSRRMGIVRIQSLLFEHFSISKICEQKYRNFPNFEFAASLFIGEDLYNYLNLLGC